ncbi:hypothetical protein [Fibrivirga algicola]|uniref:Uncharacterized protein n=1 Tax=Fibrivirga algicola TaxID=2950420 RepID=A0ABX0QBN2_9BACT|nr:hypothetical protein [Fibrivirga algicola]NID09529.1 hypothetical protein [Fibrivirga algicola]
MKTVKLIGLVFLLLLIDSAIRFVILITHSQKTYVDSVGDFFREYLSFTAFHIYYLGLIYWILAGLYALIASKIPVNRASHLALGAVIALAMYLVYAIYFFLELRSKQFYLLVIAYPLLGGLFGAIYYNIYRRK